MAEEEIYEDEDTQEETSAPTNTGILKVQAKVTDGPSAEVAYDFGTNLDDAVAKFSPEVVFSLFRAQAKIQLQAAMRRWMTAEPPMDVPSKAALWRPGVVSERTIDPVAVTKQYLANLSTPEEKAAFLKELQGAL